MQDVIGFYVDPPEHALVLSVDETERALDLIVDNYATHKHPKVRAWLERYPRVHFHFTDLLKAVKGFFAKLTLKRGVFKGIVDLQAAINRYLAATNDNPTPFTWTDPAASLEKVRRGKQALKWID